MNKTKFNLVDFLMRDQGEFPIQIPLIDLNRTHANTLYGFKLQLDI